MKNLMRKDVKYSIKYAALPPTISETNTCAWIMGYDVTGVTAFFSMYIWDKPLSYTRDIKKDNDV